MIRTGSATAAILAAAIVGAGLGSVLATRPAPDYAFLHGAELISSDRGLRVFGAEVSASTMLDRARRQYPSAFFSSDRGAVTLSVPRRVGKRYSLIGRPERTITVVESSGRTFVRVREFYSPNQFEVALDWMRDKLEI